MDIQATTITPPAETIIQNGDDLASNEHLEQISDLVSGEYIP